MKTESPVLARIRAREPIALGRDTEDAAVAFFKTHPESGDCYVRWDNVVYDGEAYRARMTSRTAQLVSISTDGFPLNVSRKHRHVAARLAQ